MRVSIFGLGYVGAVSCGCLAQDGHDVIGVDVSATKVSLINEGCTPIIEEQIGEIIHAAVKGGKLKATTDTALAVRETDISIISVGTPSRPNGSLNIDAVRIVSEQIGAEIAKKDSRHIIVVRSTVLPGTVRKIALPALEKASGKKAGEGFGLCFNPEFLREGSSVKDHYDPPFTLVGSDVEADAKTVAGLFDATKGEKFFSGVETAEMVKYVCNAFHALKLTFANEVGIVAQSLGVDSHLAMELVCKDTKLNISPAYMRPGFAFGGSCLPKDVRALIHQSRSADLETPLINGIMASNTAQIDRARNLILSFKKKKIAMLGISFKAGTDDLRESPIVTVTEALIGKGQDIRIYDASVAIAALVGANKEYIEREIPHISSLFVGELAAAVEHAEVIVVGNNAPEFKAQLPKLLRPGQIVVDLAHVAGLADIEGVEYHGISW